MKNNCIDFTIQDAGCLIWLAPKSLGGLSPEEVGQIWMGTGDKKVADLVSRGILMPMGLYQDDGYNVRFITRDMTAQEEAEWTACVRWKLHVPCGQVIVSGSLSEDLEDEMAEMAPATHGGAYWVGAFVGVPPGEYQVEVYGYPPGDLSAGWGHITNTSLFGTTPGIEPESELEYFRRTRPNEEPPAWITRGYSEIAYVNFVVRLSPLTGDLRAPELEADGCLKWEFRKPEICPVGIRWETPEAY